MSLFFDVAKCTTALSHFLRIFLFINYNAEADKNFALPGRSIHVDNAFLISLISMVTTSPYYHDNRCLIKSALVGMHGSCFQWKFISMAIPVAQLPAAFPPALFQLFGVINLLSSSRYEYLVRSDTPVSWMELPFLVFGMWLDSLRGV